MRSSVIPTDNDLRILGTLSRMPFSEHRELAAFAGLPSSSTLDSLSRLHAGGLADFVRHTRSDTSRVRRWCLAPDGSTRPAAMLGTVAGTLNREQPLSAEWSAYLLQRLDVVAVLYRVAHEAALLCDGPIGWSWRQDDASDAFMDLADGRRFALLRLGRTLPSRDVRRRMGLLYGLQRELRCPSALLLVPGVLEAQRLRADLRGRAIDAFVVVEDDLMLAIPGLPGWRALDSSKWMTLEQVMAASRRSQKVTDDHGPGRASKPPAGLPDVSDDPHHLATRLTLPERRILDSLYDWPVMSVEHLGALLGMSGSMLKKSRADLTKRGLVCQMRIGETAELRQLTGTRLCLSPDGVRYLARRDGSDEEGLLERWGVVPDACGDGRLAVRGYRIDGSRLRVLVRELSHTDGVSDILAMLSVASREDADWRLLQMLPPHRWERWFTYNGAWRCIRPDATLCLEHRGGPRAYFLEYEQSAVRPAAMRAKLEKYLWYFGSVDSRRDFDGRQARVLFVFTDEITADLFRSVAAREYPRPFPLLVSSLEKLTETGLLEKAWKSPWHLRGGYVSLAARH